MPKMFLCSDAAPSANIVSKANEDFPLPLNPVITVRLLRGSSTSTFFRLCTRAPNTSIFSVSLSIILLIISISARPRITGQHIHLFLSYIPLPSAPRALTTTKYTPSLTVLP